MLFHRTLLCEDYELGGDKGVNGKKCVIARYEAIPKIQSDSTNRGLPRYRSQ